MLLCFLTYQNIFKNFRCRVCILLDYFSLVILMHVWALANVTMMYLELFPVELLLIVRVTQGVWCQHNLLSTTTYYYIMVFWVVNSPLLSHPRAFVWLIMLLVMVFIRSVIICNLLLVRTSNCKLYLIMQSLLPTGKQGNPTLCSHVFILANLCGSLIQPYFRPRPNTLSGPNCCHLYRTRLMSKPLRILFLRG